MLTQWAVPPLAGLHRHSGVAEMYLSGILICYSIHSKFRIFRAIRKLINDYRLHYSTTPLLHI